MEPSEPCDDTPPRGFLDFDKDQLDPVRREYMKKLRIKMLDFNEEYLSKHPQVEAILRLIVMEVVCHKPFNVRLFIKQLLMSDNLETRVAKIILSKRINLERSHTREYFKQVAELESKSGKRESERMESWVWPEPRPRRPTSYKEQPGYSHLHYFKEPFWLFPKELLRVADKREKPDPRTLPAWLSGYRQAEFFQKWGAAFLGGVKSQDEGGRKRRKCSVRLLRDLIKRYKKSKKSQPEGDEDEEEYQIFKGDVTEINKSRLLNCPTCKLTVRQRVADHAEVRTSAGLVRRTRKSTSSFGGRNSLEGVLEGLERAWKDGERLRVRRRGERLEDERGVPLQAVGGCADLEGCATFSSLEPALAQTKWHLRTPGDNITFAVPEDRLLGVDPRTDPKEMLDLDDPAVPAKYRTPLYQVIIPKKKTTSMIIEESIPSQAAPQNK